MILKENLNFTQIIPFIQDHTVKVCVLRLRVFTPSVHMSAPV